MSYCPFQNLYRLRVGTFDTSPNSGDSLTFHNGQAFSTIDRPLYCAEMYKGAWWYKYDDGTNMTHVCLESNLNGYNYGTGDKIPFGTGIQWKTFTTYDHSLKSDVMAIRPMI